jgi:hypothetical protein
MGDYMRNNTLHLSQIVVHKVFNTVTLPFVSTSQLQFFLECPERSHYSVINNSHAVGKLFVATIS